MGRKKIGVGTNQAFEPFELKPFCYYCEKDFDTIKTLIQHQRTKHFNCAECGAKFDTVTGLRVHMLNAYKKTMKEVPNCIPGRENPDIVVHGMEGLPKGILEEKTQKALAEKSETDKLKEEERKERLKALAAERVARGLPEEEEEPPPPPKETKKIRALQVTPPPPVPTPPPTLVHAAPVVLQYAAPSQQRPAAMSAPEAMPSLSPNVMALLSGGAAAAARAQANADEVTTVPGLRGHLVPSALAGLHPVALHVLAAAGVLLQARGGADGGAVSSASAASDNTRRQTDMQLNALTAPGGSMASMHSPHGSLILGAMDPAGMHQPHAMGPCGPCGMSAAEPDAKRLRMSAPMVGGMGDYL